MYRTQHSVWHEALIYTLALIDEEWILRPSGSTHHVPTAAARQDLLCHMDGCHLAWAYVLQTHTYLAAQRDGEEQEHKPYSAARSF